MNAQYAVNFVLLAFVVIAVVKITIVDKHWAKRTQRHSSGTNAARERQISSFTQNENNVASPSSKTSFNAPRPLAKSTRDAPFINEFHTIEAVQWVKEHIKPPSTKPYNLPNGKADPNLPAGYQDYSQFGQSPAMANKHFKGKRNGRFLEVGAHDGVSYSNSLLFERYYNWTGLLIEPIASRYASVVGRNRKTYTLNACLGFFARPTPVTLGAIGQCTGVPLSAVLQAMGWTKWDWFIIDVDGAEVGLLLSIPWHTIQVDYVQIECNLCDPGHINGPPVGNTIPDHDRRYFLKEFMKAIGYTEVDWLAPDFIYRRNGLKA